MYQKKFYQFSDDEKKAVEEMTRSPWFRAICKKAEYEFNEAWKYMLWLTQILNTKKDEDMETLEKEWIHALAVDTFLKEIKFLDNQYFWQES